VLRRADRRRRAAQARRRSVVRARHREPRRDRCGWHVRRAARRRPGADQHQVSVRAVGVLSRSARDAVGRRRTHEHGDRRRGSRGRSGRRHVRDVGVRRDDPARRHDVVASDRVLVDARRRRVGQLHVDHGDRHRGQRSRVHERARRLRDHRDVGRQAQQRRRREPGHVLLGHLADARRVDVGEPGAADHASVVVISRSSRSLPAPLRSRRSRGRTRTDNRDRRAASPRSARARA